MLAASLAALPCVRIELEKTIAYAPAEVCAYRYLAECHMEQGHPETAALWYERGIEQEPMLFDIMLSKRIETALADSLLKAGEPARAARGLQRFVDRLEMLGRGGYWQLEELYLRLGAAYRASGDTEQALQTWRKGIRIEESGVYYGSPVVLSMAESLKVYSETFTDDSVAAVGSGMEVYPEDFMPNSMVWSWTILFCLAVWFVGGGMVLLPFAVLRKVQVVPADPAVLLHAKHYLWADFLVCVIAPLVAGAAAAMAMHAVARPLIFLFCGGVTIMGIAGALIDALRRAHRYGAPVPAITVAVVGTLWLSVSIALAVASVFTTGMVALVFLMGSLW